MAKRQGGAQTTDVPRAGRAAPRAAVTPGGKEPATIALYPGSFDPPTLGHLDVIARAAKIFPKLIIGIGRNREKPGLFTVAERLEMLRESCRAITAGSIEFASFEGLVSTFAKQHGVSILLRGLRGEADMAFELQMADGNRVLFPGADTVFMAAAPQFSRISSSLVREIIAFDGDPSSLVPKPVREALRQRRGKR